MKRFSASEKGLMVLAICFIASGCCLVIFPKEMYVIHPGGVPSQAILGSDSPPEHLSKEKTRKVGILVIVLGATIGLLPFYSPRR